MRFRRMNGWVVFLVFVLSAFSARAKQQEPMKSNIQSIKIWATKPPRDEKQQIVLRGVQFFNDAMSLRVFINPAKTTLLSPDTPGYVGTISATQSDPGKVPSGDYSLVLDNAISGAADVVLQPITSDGKNTTAPVRVKTVQISPVTNKTVP